MKEYSDLDQQWMAYALRLARSAAHHHEVPVGAVLVYNDQIIGKGSNQPIDNCDPTAHAEIIALRAGAHRIKNYRLLKTTLYVTLEPCTMCIGAMFHARINRVVFGAYDPQSGIERLFTLLAAASRLNHKIAWKGGVLAHESRVLLKNFFKERR